MRTEIIKTIGHEENIDEQLMQAASCLAGGGLVAFPTETVYGLGADALNEKAAAKIYAAKGRPSDNPLIVHIAKVSDMEVLAHVNERARLLAESFWPGPLTIVLPKKDIVPSGTTGGLDTVAIRMPSHPAALSLIRNAGVYVAAPSANTSGRPSPTKASHVEEDMMGRIDYIVDGGEVGIGIESTIVDVSGEETVILRPGYITKEMLELVVGPVQMDPALDKPLTEDVRPKAPGMKYTHYAPKASLTIVEGENVPAHIVQLVKEKQEQGFQVGIMCAKETEDFYKGQADYIACVGERTHEETVAAKLYAALRDFDQTEVAYIYAESFRGEGISVAIMNRLLKAAGQKVIHV